MVIMSEVTDSDALLREVYSTFGLALHRAQDIEYAIIHLLIWAEVGDGSYRAFEQSEVANANLFRQTMGAMNKLLMARLPFVSEPKMDELLIRAIGLRNFLAHEYFRQRTVALMFRESQRQMIEELTYAVAFFEEVSSLIWGLTSEFFGEHMAREGYFSVTERAWKKGFGDPLPGL
jgi:hypothetical protein